MSLLARSAAAPLRQVAVRARAAPVRSMHGEYKVRRPYELVGVFPRPLTWCRGLQHIPFDYSKKGIFGAKVAAYLVTGFSVPFVAAYYQLYVFISRCHRGGGLTRFAGASPLARHRMRRACTYCRPANLYRHISLEIDGRAFVTYPPTPEWCHPIPWASGASSSMRLIVRGVHQVLDLCLR